MERIKRKLVCSLVDTIARVYLRKNDRRDFLRMRIDTPEALWRVMANELRYIVGSKKSSYLTSVNIEATNRCNFQCAVCPTHTMMTRKKGMMSEDVFRKILAEIDGLESVQFSHWGEPLLHSHIGSMIARAGDRQCKTLLTTNGGVLDESRQKELLDAGLTRITFSVDGVFDTYTRMRGYEYGKIKKTIANFKKLRDAHSYKTKIDVSCVVADETKAELTILQEEFYDLADRVQFVPIFTQAQRIRKCRELWRGAPTVFWDGQVSPCCVDYNGVLIVGSIMDTSLQALFNSEKWQSMRHDHSQRCFRQICEQCSEYVCEGVSARFD